MTLYFLNLFGVQIIYSYVEKIMHFIQNYDFISNIKIIYLIKLIVKIFSLLKLTQITII